MKGANPQLKPVWLNGLLAQDGAHMTRASRMESGDPTAVAHLQAISDSRPEVSAALMEMQEATLKLALMLPRSMFEQLVERVIDWLDELDGDPDLELIDEGESEPEY